MANYQRDKQLSDNDPIVIQLEQNHMSAKVFMELLSRPAHKSGILCYWYFNGSILAHWLEDIEV